MQLLVPARDEPGLFAAGGPGLLAGTHPAWAEDMDRFGPFSPAQEQGLFALGPRPLHRGPDRDGPVLVAVPQAASTMDLFWALSGSGELPAFTAAAAATQSTGRGQLRRPWDSLPGNLHVTFGLPLPGGPDAKAWNRLLPLLVGELTASVLEEAAGVPVRLKWPNDLVVNGRKVAGLLMEERAGRLAVGLGVNLVRAPGRAQLRRDHVLEAGALSDMGPGMGPLTLWSRLEKKLVFEYADTFENSDPVSFVSRIHGRLLWLGRPIMYTDGNKEVLFATLAGLSPEGGLRLEADDGGERIVYTGSIGPGSDGPVG